MLFMRFEVKYVEIQMNNKYNTKCSKIFTYKAYLEGTQDNEFC